MSAVLDRWSRRVAVGEVATVLPDGCRDAILVEPEGEQPFWTLSPLDAGPRLVGATRPIRLTGFRLHPAAAAPDLRALSPDGAEAEVRLADTRIDARLAEALDALAAAPSVAAAARRDGVTTRSLQRLCRGRTGQGPLFWIRLARIRRAAWALADGGRPVEVAADGGFADQAHLTRETRLWLGATPARLRADRARLRLAAAPGYPTAVQISTSVPSGART